MIYLVVLVLAASLAIGRLWLLQRRQRSHLQSVEGFRSGLEVLAPIAPSSRRSGPRSTASSRNPKPTRDGRTRELDPARRAAARQRIEARRKAMRSRTAS